MLHLLFHCDILYISSNCYSVSFKSTTFAQLSSFWHNCSSTKKKKCNQVTAILYALNVFAVILARLKCYQMHLTEKIPKQYRKVFTACTFAPNHFRLWKLTDCLKSGQVCAELSFKENVNRRFISNTHKEYSWGEKAQSDSNHTCHQPWRVFLW